MIGSEDREPGSLPGEMAALRADSALRKRLRDFGESSPGSLTWKEYDELVAAVDGAFLRRAETRSFRYLHPISLQDPAMGVGKPYNVNLAVHDWSWRGASGGCDRRDHERFAAISTSWRWTAFRNSA